MAHLSAPSPLGPLSIFEDGGAIIALEWGRIEPEGVSPVLQAATEQLKSYFAGEREAFDLPLAPTGTDHEQAVWRAMLDIPFGETRTYGDLATDIGSVARAVGGACGRNPIPIIIPCHRVVGANGSMTGFSGGEGVETKEWLLRHEGALLL